MSSPNHNSKYGNHKENETIREIKFSILFVLLAVLLAFGTYNTLGLGLNTDTPIVSVISPSMEPVYYRGDLLLVYGVPFDELKVGDVIVFSVEGLEIPIVHRIIYKRDNCSRYDHDPSPTVCVGTKGDNNAGQLPVEKKIFPEQVKGKVVFSIPKIGYVKLFIVEIFDAVTKPI